MAPRTDDDEVTPELTGHDASVDEADSGDAGSGASPWGADRTGLETPPDELPDSTREFEAPDPTDIAPDRIERMRSERRAEEEEQEEPTLSARPSESPERQALSPDNLPLHDPWETES